MPGGDQSKQSPASDTHAPSTKRSTPSDVANVKIFDLPPKLIRLIFAKLDSIAEVCKLMEVCKKFADVAKSPELWKCVKAEDPITQRARDQSSSRLYRFVTYESRKDRNEEIGAKDASEALKRRRCGLALAVDVITSRAGDQLESLDLVDCYPNFPRYDHQMTDDDLDVISDRCSKALHTVRLSPSSFLSGSKILSFAKACLNIRVLHMISCPSLTDILLGEIALACPRLENISVSRCKSFHGEGLHARLIPVHDTLRCLDISETGTVLLNLPGFMRSYAVLEELNASSCTDQLRIEGPQLEDDDFRFRTLVRLDLCEVDVDAKLLDRVVSESTHLRELHLSPVVRFRDMIDTAFLFKLPWPPLKLLSLESCDLHDEVWQTLFNTLSPSLTYLDVAENRSLTCSLDVKDGQGFPLLRELDIRRTSTTEETLEMLLSISPALESLNSVGCMHISRGVRKDPFRLRVVDESSNAGPAASQSSSPLDAAPHMTHTTTRNGK